MVEAACESDIDWVGGSLLNPASDSLAIERGALSAGLAPSEGGGVTAAEGEEGRLVGRKREGRRAFIMIAYWDIERVTEVRGVTEM
jgi:hypothetical protein